MKREKQGIRFKGFLFEDFELESQSFGHYIYFSVNGYDDAFMSIDKELKPEHIYCSYVDLSDIKNEWLNELFELFKQHPSIRLKLLFNSNI